MNVTLPGGNVAAIRGGDVDRTELQVRSERPRWLSILDWFRSHRIPLVIGAGIGVIGLIAVVSLTGDDEPPATAPGTATGSTAGTPATESPDAMPGTTAPSAVAVATTAPADACAAAAQQDYDMQFSSVDVIDGIGEEFSQRAGEETGYQTPSFTWSGIPQAATELAIVMQWVPENRREDIVSATDLWETAEPAGSSRWVLRGIDPTSTGIDRTNLDTGLPEGTHEVDHTGGVVQIGGAPAANKFLGPDAPGRTYMFTLLALCDPELGTPFDESLGWFRRFAIDTTWFFADAEF